MRSPFSLFKYKTKTGLIWYARFYNQKSGEVIKTKSTGISCTGKKGRKIEAYKKAELILNELEEKNKSPYFIPYLEAFWTKNSPYVKSKRVVEKNPLSNLYIEINVSVIKNHIKPYKPFQKIRLSELKPGMIEDWKLWALEKNKTGTRRVNTSLNCMKVAVRYSVSRGDILNNPFQSIRKVAYSPREKGILNQKEVGKLINSKESDHRVKLAVLLAVLCGMRRGEARGIRWKDIDRENGLLNVQNNYVDTEGAKGCKAGSDRQVVLPEALNSLLDNVKSISPYTKPNHYILFSLNYEERPLSVDIIRKGFRRVLKGIGIDRDEQKERNLTFHGMRHTFVTLARMAGLSDITVQALAGHKTGTMMNHYSHGGQVIDFEDARKKMKHLSNQDAGNEPIKGAK
ncbi:MAG: site-specific integrase [Spirochaetales bacterium]|nr:site-specific integrase [Spirochaetales bacterium]